MAQAKTKKKPVIEPNDRSSNMWIWDAVQTTDPAFTKPLKQFGGKFTTVNTIYNCKRATQLWGPAGKGWGTTLHSAETIRGEALDDTGTHSQLFTCLLSVWWRDESGEVYDGIKQYGSAFLVKKDRRGIVVDDEAPKKAMTDALGKSLSYFGFSGDIYLGMWDDNKYVEGVKHAKQEEARVSQREIQDDYIIRIDNAKNKEELETIWGETKQLRDSDHDTALLVDRFTKRNREIRGVNVGVQIGEPTRKEARIIVGDSIEEILDAVPIKSDD